MSVSSRSIYTYTCDLCGITEDVISPHSERPLPPKWRVFRHDTVTAFNDQAFCPSCGNNFTEPVFDFFTFTGVRARGHIRLNVDRSLTNGWRILLCVDPTGGSYSPPVPFDEASLDNLIDAFSSIREAMKQQIRIAERRENPPQEEAPAEKEEEKEEQA